MFSNFALSRSFISCALEVRWPPCSPFFPRRWDILAPEELPFVINRLRLGELCSERESLIVSSWLKAFNWLAFLPIEWSRLLSLDKGGSFFLSILLFASISLENCQWSHWNIYLTTIFWSMLTDNFCSRFKWCLYSRMCSWICCLAPVLASLGH